MDMIRFEEIISKFSTAKVAVLGDFFLDLYIQLDRSLSEFSLETHKEAYQAIELRDQPGAAGVVTNNLVALGAKSAAVGYIGKDGHGYMLRQALEARGINTNFLIATADRFTPTYTKPIMQELNGQNAELNRIDIVNRSPNPSALNLSLTENVRSTIASYDGILVVEQVQKDDYGAMSPLLRDVLSVVARENPEKIIMVDSRHFAADYKRVSLKMNLSEAANAVEHLDSNFADIDIKDKLSAAALCARAFWEAHQRPAFITLGDEGISGMADDVFFHFPGFHIEGPVDIVGAGDSVLAGIGLALCVGATAQEAAYIGNLVGSITVQQLGTTGTATQEDLFRRHQEYQNQIKE